MTRALFSLKNIQEKNYPALAKGLLAHLKQGDCLALHGGLGAGKTSFARSFLRQYLNDENAEVPSPTFTIAQHYPDPDNTPNKPSIWHYDFYRIEDEDEVLELGFEDNVEHSISLIEWPERIPSHLPSHTLFIQFDQDPDKNHHKYRDLNFRGGSQWSGLYDTIKNDPEISGLLTDEK